jgi:hypothetical protein
MAASKKKKPVEAEKKEESPAFDFRKLTEEQKTILFKYMFTGKLPRHKLKPRVVSIDESAHPLAISREMFDSMMRIATYFAARGNWRVCRELVSEAFTSIRRSDYFASPSYGVAIHYAEIAEYDLRKDRDETVGQTARNALTMRYVRARLALYIRALRLEYRNSPEFT